MSPDGVVRSLPGFLKTRAVKRMGRRRNKLLKEIKFLPVESYILEEHFSKGLF